MTVAPCGFRLFSAVPGTSRAGGRGGGSCRSEGSAHHLRRRACCRPAAAGAGSDSAGEQMAYHHAQVQRAMKASTASGCKRPLRVTRQRRCSAKHWLSAWKNWALALK